MKRFKYMRLKLSDLPNDIIKQQPLQNNHQVQLRLYQSEERNIWTSPSRNINTRIVGKATEKKVISTKQTHPSFLEALLAASLFLPLCGNVWRQACQQGACQVSQ